MPSSFFLVTAIAKLFQVICLEEIILRVKNYKKSEKIKISLFLEAHLLLLCIYSNDDFDSLINQSRSSICLFWFLTTYNNMRYKS